MYEEGGKYVDFCSTLVEAPAEEREILEEPDV